ncbi:MAG: hypothetical protein EXX96DRAFT_583222 [Benjaminiella poitrasii]|nr:MAG: hypothetical protein EXX96DRAFT_583222 [Benjaminiella poitrasii]
MQIMNLLRECNFIQREGYCMLGYYHKSRTTEDRDEVLKTLQAMIAGLKNRSLIEYFYVSASCNSKTPINKRDLKKNMIIAVLSGVNDSMKELAKMDKTCLVVIDLAGLTTNMSDLELLFRACSRMR